MDQMKTVGGNVPATVETRPFNFRETTSSPVTDEIPEPPIPPQPSCQASEGNTAPEPRASTSPPKPQVPAEEAQRTSPVLRRSSRARRPPLKLYL